MAKGGFEQLDEQVKSQHRYWESLSPEDRRALIIRMRDTPAKGAGKNIILLVGMGLLFSAATVLFWVNQFKFGAASNLGIAGGMILVVLSLQYIQSNKITSRRKLETNDFTDADVLAYFEEHERINERALEQWNQKGKYIVFIVGGLLVLLFIIPLTFQFAFMVLFSSVSTFFLK